MIYPLRGALSLFYKSMKLAERCIDSKDGSDAAWDAIHNWLHMRGLDMSATAEEGFNEMVQDFLESTDVQEVK